MRPRFLSSLRARVALVVIFSTALTLGAVGYAVVRSYQAGDLSRIDTALESRGKRVGDALADYTKTPGQPEGGGERPQGETSEAAPLTLAAVGFDAESTFGDPGGLVVTLRGKTLLQSGRIPGQALASAQTGLRTLSTPETGDWRVLSLDASGARIVTATPLGATERRVHDLTERALLLGLAGLLGAALLGWVLAGLATASIRRLRDSADQVSGTEDLDIRVPEPSSPAEVAALAHGVNQMLERLEHSHADTAQARDAARRFAAEAGHELRTPMTAIGTNLDLLAQPGALQRDTSEELVADLRHEHSRLVRLLDSLQALARGDAAGDLPSQATDLADLAGAAVMSVRAGHRTADLSVSAPEDGITFMGQPEGLRRICENLLENSVRHGREDGRAVLTVATDGTEATITCDDDGPGIAPADRLHVMGRFARGTDARGDGSGLGLALVEQQALLHGGRVVIGDSDLGGARVEVHLPLRA